MCVSVYVCKYVCIYVKLWSKSDSDRLNANIDFLSFKSVTTLQYNSTNRVNELILQINVCTRQDKTQV